MGAVAVALTVVLALLLAPASSLSATNAASARSARHATHRHLLQEGGGNTYTPEGSPGVWESGGSTGCIMVHAVLTRDGKLIGWSNKDQGLQTYGSVVYDPATRTATQLLDECGIHACKNAFCGGMAVTYKNEVVIMGGHARDIPYFRHYTPNEGTLLSGDLTLGNMSSPRWYPGVHCCCVTTLPEGNLLVVGGVDVSGDGGYFAEAKPESDNPTYEIYDPETKTFSGNQPGMAAQLSEAFPIHTYPLVLLQPDGGVVVSAGSTLVKYRRDDAVTFTREAALPNRPGAPWSYPQTGAGVTLPSFPPYETIELLAGGGVSEDRASNLTRASAAAEIIELTAGADAAWRSVGPMPYSRVMGDAVVLCDGTVGFFNGAGVGIAGWDKRNPQTMTFKDGSSWQCVERCTKAREPRYEPSIFDPETGKWSAAGSLAEAGRPRLYHSTAVLLPDCTVFTAGSDVTWDQTAEIFQPPYLFKGPRPDITSVHPTRLQPGADLVVDYTSEDPVTRALLLRGGAQTHSVGFDPRSFWLDIASNQDGTLVLKTPPTGELLPPGIYMVTILSDKGVPAVASMLTVEPSPRQAAAQA